MRTANDMKWYGIALAAIIGITVVTNVANELTPKSTTAPAVDVVAEQVQAAVDAHEKRELTFDCAGVVDGSDTERDKKTALRYLNCVINLRTEDQLMFQEVSDIAHRAGRPLPQSFIRLHYAQDEFWAAYSEFLSYVAYSDKVDASEMKELTQNLSTASRAFRIASADEANDQNSNLTGLRIPTKARSK